MKRTLNLEAEGHWVICVYCR